MRVRTFIYDSNAAPDHVAAVLDLLAEREEPIEFVDVGADGEGSQREAMLALRESIRIGGNPDAIYDEEGAPDFAPGVLVTEDERGRRSVHVGREALDALDGESPS